MPRGEDGGSAFQRSAQRFALLAGEVHAQAGVGDDAPLVVRPSGAAMRSIFLPLGRRNNAVVIIIVRSSPTWRPFWALHRPAVQLACHTGAIVVLQAGGDDFGPARRLAVHQAHQGEVAPTPARPDGHLLLRPIPWQDSRYEAIVEELLRDVHGGGEETARVETQVQDEALHSLRVQPLQHAGQVLRRVLPEEGNADVGDPAFLIEPVIPVVVRARRNPITVSGVAGPRFMWNSNRPSTSAHRTHRRTSVPVRPLILSSTSSTSIPATSFTWRRRSGSLEAAPSSCVTPVRTSPARTPA